MRQLNNFEYFYALLQKNDDLTMASKLSARPSTGYLPCMFSSGIILHFKLEAIRNHRAGKK
jgi:hypothetical protein